MKTDIAGKLRNTPLAEQNALLPLYEMIANSIHAIEDLGPSYHGQIRIHLHRDLKLSVDESPDALVKPIFDITVTDNGIGFTNDNFLSFQTSDSTHKVARGGKGLGRFSWLKAFEWAQIESIFEEDGQWFKRTFDFVPRGNGIANEVLKKVEPTTRKTSIKLMSFKEKYKKKARHKAKTIGSQVIEHYLYALLSKSCPELLLVDDSEDSILNINDLFANTIKVTTQSETISVKGQDFVLTCSKLYPGNLGAHSLHLCAHDRSVLDFDLVKYIPDAGKTVLDENGNEFTFLAYLSGKFLDEHVNSDRTDFSVIVKHEDGGFDYPFPTKQVIIDSAVARVKAQLGMFLESTKQEKFELFRRYINEKAPEYKALLKYKQKALELLSPNLTEDKLDIEFHKILRDLEIEAKKEGIELLSVKEKAVKESSKYKEAFNDYVEKVSDIGSSRLAQYVVHRKTILSLLEANLELGDDGRYGLEASIHSLVFPMSEDSNSVNYESQNLWLIDERLSFHSYLASDKKLKKYSNLENESDDRPDVIVFNKPLAYTDNPYPYSSIVIIEFKRPERDEYADDENPISQVYDYIELIRSGKAKDPKGKTISTLANVPFYCYIVCSLTPKMKRFSRHATLVETPDRQGFYGYNQAHSAYVEVLDYQKLLEDSKKRNQVLFQKLGLPIN